VIEEEGGGGDKCDIFDNDMKLLAIRGEGGLLKPTRRE